MRGAFAQLPRTGMLEENECFKSIVTAGPKSSQKHRLKISQPYNETQRCVLA